MLHAREIFRSRKFPIAFSVLSGRSPGKEARHVPGSHVMRGEIQCATKRSAQLAGGGGMKDDHEPSSTMMKGCCVKLYWVGGVAAEIDLVLILSMQC